MAITAVTGPLVAFGKSRNPNTGIGIAADNNPMGGPSSFQDNYGMGDNRAQFAYVPGQNDTHPYLIWLNAGFITMDFAPATATVGAIAPTTSSGVTSGTPMTLITTTAAGVTVGASTVNFNTGVKVTGLLAIGGATGMVGFGALSPQSTNVWDPTTTLARGVAITAGSAATGGNFSVFGYDLYGAPMHETITAVAASQVKGKKAWKYIASVTPAFTDATHQYSCDTTDIIGFPLYNSIQAYSWIWYPQPALITSASGYVAGLSLASTSTATTADVRGTYALQSASNGTNKIVLFQSISVLNQSTANGVYGVAQF